MAVGYVEVIAEDAAGQTQAQDAKPPLRYFGAHILLATTVWLGLARTTDARLIDVLVAYGRSGPANVDFATGIGRISVHHEDDLISRTDMSTQGFGHHERVAPIQDTDGIPRFQLESKNSCLTDRCVRCELAFDSRFHVFPNPGRSSRCQTACLDGGCDIA